MLAANPVDQFMASLDLPEVYAVGGSVRDEILGRSSKDHDYVVRNATIKQLEKALTRGGAKGITKLVLRDGRQVGVRATIPKLATNVEVVLPRREKSTGPGHRDFRIDCNPKLPLKDDALRRDFTINAMFKDVRSGELHDPLNGKLDIEDRLIRTTHPDSFQDDPLRTLRALRFVSQLGFDLDRNTHLEMKLHASKVTALTLKGVSNTALSELEGILMGFQPGESLRVMCDTGVLQVLLPEIASIIGFEQESAYHDKHLDSHTFDAIQAAAAFKASLRVRMALLFHDAGKPWMAWTGADGRKHYYELTVAEILENGHPPTAMHSHEWWGAFLAAKALERLNAPNPLRRHVATLIGRHMLPLERGVRSMKVRMWRHEIGDSLLHDLILHRSCDVLGKGGDTMAAIDALLDIQSELDRSIADGVPRSTKDLLITGNDLVGLGLKGPAIGEVQRQLLLETMAQPKLNEHEWLLGRARKLAKSL